MHYRRDLRRRHRENRPKPERKRCSVNGCDRVTVGFGYCSPHYQRLKKGLPIDGPIAKRCKTREERFATYTVRDPETGCLNWTAGMHNGYGVIGEQVGGKLAHRIAYEMATGEKLDAWDHIHHKCANRACVEPTHLQRMKPCENTAEMHSRRAYEKRIAELERMVDEYRKLFGDIELRQEVCL